jgi:hypothetical protein
MHSSCCDQPTCFIIPLIALIFYLQPNGSGLAEGTCAKPGTEAEGNRGLSAGAMARRKKPVP